jgi:serine/threonine protein kinase
MLADSGDDDGQLHSSDELSSADGTDKFGQSEKHEDDQALRKLDHLLREMLRPEQNPDIVTGQSLEGESELAGKLPGRFSFKRTLGDGTFGVVFLCQDHRLKREVAVKVLRPEWMTSQKNRQRFLREARAAAKLNHTHAVRILEADENDSVAWLVCDFIDGAALSDHIKTNGPLPVRVAVRLMAELSEAVEHAHQTGIVHRDIKPDNIVISKGLGARLDDAHAHLTDFGLAKILGDDLDLSSSGTLLGTPRYMSPEQFDDDAAKNQPATDIYSMGVVLFECLTGKCPFSEAQTLAKRIKQGLHLLPRLRSVDPLLSKDLDSICRKSMEPCPEDRYSSAGQLAQDLRNYLLDLPISARPMSTPERLARWVQQNRLTSALMGVIAAGLIGVAVVSTMANITFRRTNRSLTETNTRLTKEQSRSQELADLASSSQKRLSRLAYDSKIHLAYALFEKHALKDAYDEMGKIRDEFPDANVRLDWRLLNAELRGLVQPLPKLTSAINQVQSIPNSSFVAAVSGAGQVYIVDCGTGTKVSQFDSGIQSLHSLAVHPHQNILAVGGANDGALAHRPILFDWKTQTRSQQLRSFPTTIESLKFSTDGRFLLAASRYEKPKQLDLQENRAYQYPGKNSNRWLAFLEPLQLFAFQKDSKTISLVQPGHAQVLQDLSFSSYFQDFYVLCAAEIPNTPLLAVVLNNFCDPLIVDVSNGEVVATLNLDLESRATCIQSDSTGKLLACGFSAGVIQIWPLEELNLVAYKSAAELPSIDHSDLTDEDHSSQLSVNVHGTNSELKIREKQSFQIFSSSVVDLSFSDDKLVCASEAGEMVALTVPQFSNLQSHPSLPPKIGSSTIAHYADKVMEVRVAKWSTSKPILALRLRHDEVVRIDFDEMDQVSMPEPADGKVVSATALNHTVGTSQSLLNSQIQSSHIISDQLDINLDLAISADASKLLWSVSNDELGNWKDGQLKTEQIKGITDPSKVTLIAVSMSPDAKYLLVMTEPKLARVYELASPGKTLSQFTVPGEISCVDWHPDGKSLAIGGEFPNVLVIDVNTGVTLKSLSRIGGTQQLRYLKGGELLLSTHTNGQVRFTSLHDIDNPTVVSHRSRIVSMVINSDETIGISFDEAHQVEVWSLTERRRIGLLSDLSNEGQRWIDENPSLVKKGGGGVRTEQQCLWLAPDDSQLLLLFESRRRPMLRRWMLK